MNPYELLGVTPKASIDQIKSAYRKLSKKYHPDKEGGDPEKFNELRRAVDILSDPERRKRYDESGRTDKSPVTPERVRDFISQTMTQLLNSRDPMGFRDDPVHNNIREQIIQSLLSARREIKNIKAETQRRIERATRMLERFKPSEKFDPVGDALREKIRELNQEFNRHDDALELSREVERVLKTYDYDVGPAWEGQDHTGPTTRRDGIRFIR